jgi:transcriptional regulator with XRE-family HTH domain
MSIGQRIRQIREEKGISQGDIEKATGMLRGYISRVEHGHTIPSLETLERFAGALDVPMYQFFRDWERESAEDLSAEMQDEETGGLLSLLKKCVRSMPETNRALLLDVARKLAYR